MCAGGCIHLATYIGVVVWWDEGGTKLRSNRVARVHSALLCWLAQNHGCTVPGVMAGFKVGEKSSWLVKGAQFAPGPSLHTYRTEPTVSGRNNPCSGGTCYRSRKHRGSSCQQPIQLVGVREMRCWKMQGGRVCVCERERAGCSLPSHERSDQVDTIQ
jgi:hypothetical protein